MLPLLEVEEVVAASFEAQAIDFCLSLFTFDLGLRLRMRYQQGQVFEEACVLLSQAPLADDQDTLPILPLFRLGVLIGECSQLVFLIDFEFRRLL